MRGARSVADYSPATMRSARSRHLDALGFGALVITATLGLWTLVTWMAARAEGFSPLDTEPWGHWDTGWYRTIALDGYSFGHCDGVGNRAPTDYCGATGWFPGYPYINRLVSHLGMSVDSAGRLVSLVAFVVMLAVLWFCFLSSRPRSHAIPAMALTAVFPGSIYFGAIFPVSIVAASMLGCLALLQRGRWAAAGACGALGAVSYPSGSMIAIAALVPLLFWPDLGSWRAKSWAAAKVAGPVAAGYLLVLANYERAVGRWDAWFRVQEAYGYEPTFPWVTVWHQLQLLRSAGNVRTPGAQTLLVVVIVVVAVVMTVRYRQSLGAGERAVPILLAGLWLVPLTLGGDLSLYRAEALLVPCVILVVRSQRVVIWALALACAPVAFNMARLYFDNVLI